MMAPPEDDLPDFDEETATVEHKETKEEKKEREDLARLAAKNPNPISTMGWRDLLIKAELNRALGENGFEHPSEVQHAAIPQAILGTDVLCQAKSGMGKTAVFVIACLQTTDTSETECLPFANVQLPVTRIESRIASHQPKINEQ